MIIVTISSQSSSLVNFRGSMLKEFVKRGHQVYAFGPDYDKNVDEKLQSWDINYSTYHLKRNGTNIISDVYSYYTLKRIINKIKPDIVFSYTIKPVIYGCWAAKSCKVNNIYAMITGLGSAFDNKNSISSQLLSCITEKLYKGALKNIDGVIFQNSDDQSVFLKKDLAKKEKTYIVNGSGVDLDWYNYDNNMPISPVKFLLIGRLIKEKGIYNYIEAAKLIKQKYKNKVEFHLVGGLDTNPSSIQQKELVKWVNQEFLNYHGSVQDVRPFIKNSSVFVLPSYYGEGTPRTALEALSIGRPLITTNAPGCKETVKDGINGFLIPIKDSYRLAEAMEKFIINPTLISKMSLESRKLAEEKYDVNKVNSDILKILKLN